SGRVSPRISDLLVIGLIATAVCLGFIYIEERSHVNTPSTSETAPPPVPGEAAVQLELGANTAPLIVAWVGGGIIVLLIFVSWRMGLWRWLQRFPEFDILIVMGSLILPWATPFIITAMGVNATDYSQEGITRSLLALTPMVAVS